MFLLLRKSLIFRRLLMLNRIKHYFTLDCVIFTIMTVVLSIVFYFATWDSTVKTITVEGLFKTFGTMVFSYFTVTTVMTFLFMILEKQINENGYIGHLISMAIVLSCVYGLGGGVFNWFHIFAIWSLYAFIVLMIVYTIVFFTMFHKNVEDSNKINEKLKKIQEKNNE